ncbi:MFS transporter, partial [Candidatus Bipolaricaulota bacterium]|nr:MFS transporter [Candidatus Bipolaricaulota bacterium]
MNRFLQPVLDVVGRYDRRFWTLFGVQMIVAIGFGAAMPFVSIYLHAQLGVSMTFVGTIMLASALVAAMGRIIGGEVADRLGRRPLLV